jgi:large subunit ribosomal protein L7/L12
LATQKKTQSESSSGTATAKKSAQAGNKVETITQAIEELSVIELSELVKALEEKFGVSAAAMAVAAAPAAGQAAAGGEAAEAAEEQTEFNVVLTSFGEKKIQVIKEVRAITGLGLKEAKDLVEGAPKAIKEGVPKKEADEIKAQIAEVGGTVEIK